MLELKDRNTTLVLDTPGSKDEKARNLLVVPTLPSSIGRLRELKVLDLFQNQSNTMLRTINHMDFLEYACVMDSEEIILDFYKLVYKYSLAAPSFVAKGNVHANSSVTYS